ncbi:hypothetical protein BDL97_15G101000 [Sphagnum fallax]|nr:hypothetical protein BDL97_15G101000 [Sphagnum fallax]
MGSSGVVVSASPLSCICWDSHHHSRILLPSSCMGILQSPHFEHSIQQQLLNSNLFNRLWKSQLFSSAAAGDWVLRSSRQSPSCTSCSYIIVPRRERKRKTRTTTSSTRRRRAACFSSACATSGSQGRNEDGGANDDLAECVEIAADGTRYLHVMASSMHNVDHGSIIGLSCVPITQLPPSAVNLEFPLFLNGLASMPVQIAVQKGGLPHALEELGNLNSLDVEKVYVHSLDNDKTGGEFLVHDERLGKRFHVKSTFPQALAIALRYRQPFLLKRDTLLSANKDFVDRMIINPLAREQDGDVELLLEISERMCSIFTTQSRLQAALAHSVEAEEYEEAVWRKQELIAYDKQMDVDFLQVLQQLRSLYLERMGIFFKL